MIKLVNQRQHIPHFIVITFKNYRSIRKFRILIELWQNMDSHSYEVKRCRFVFMIYIGTNI